MTYCVLMKGWDGPEIIKAISGIALPIVVAYLAYIFNRRMHVRKRLEVFDKVAQPLNDIYCYLRFRGNWKELSPPQVIDSKRHLDKAMHIYKPLFSAETWNRYEAFVKLGFKTYTGPGLDAKIINVIVDSERGDRRKAFKDGWVADWDSYFLVPQELKEERHYMAYRADLDNAYNQLMAVFSDQIGVDATARREEE